MTESTNKSFYFKTLSGQLILINAFVFILMLLQDGNLFSPSREALVFWGATEPGLLAQGQFWRLFTANFVHFGLIHLWFNGMALKIVGYQIEKIIDKKSFLFIYLTSGVCAITASSFIHMSTGAGASGAIFGLIGVGAVLENIFDKIPLGESLRSIPSLKGKIFLLLRKRPFLGLALINVLFAVLINLGTTLFGLRIKVDNAAHLSGMLSGAVTFYALMKIRSKQSPLSSKALGWILLLSLFFSLGIGVKSLSFSNHYSYNQLEKARKSTDPVTSYYHYSEILKINPTHREGLFERGKVALFYGDLKSAFKDFEVLALEGLDKKAFDKLIDELKEANKTYEAKLVTFFITDSHFQPSKEFP